MTPARDTRMRRINGLAAVLLLLWMPLLGAADTASIPYKFIFDLYESLHVVGDDPKVELKVRVASNRASVQATDIRMSIAMADGLRDVPIDEHGYIDLPLSEALRAGNPNIVTNQPKGTLSLTADLSLKVPDALDFPYALISDAVEQLTLVVKERAGMLAWFAPRVKGITFQFVPSGAQTVTIASSRGTRILRADADGKATLMLDDEVLSDNAHVSVSERPRVLQPLFES